MLGIVSATSLSAAELVSVNKDGTDSGSDDSYRPVINADGRFVVFTSLADNLAGTDTNGMNDVFVRDRQSGTTTLVSVNKDGVASGVSMYRGEPKISADGRFVTFISYANNLVGTDTNGRNDVFVRDLQSGTTTLVSVNKDGTDSGNGYSRYPVISADGRFVAFYSSADDLVDTDTNGAVDVFVRDLQNGTTTLVSVNKDGTDSGNGGDPNNGPVISADGRFVAFESTANNLVATDTNRNKDVFVRDLQSGTTKLVSVNMDGSDSGDYGSYRPVISANGRFVAFLSAAQDLVATDTNGVYDVYVRDLQSGTTSLVSVNKDGTNSGRSESVGDVVISSDGRFVVFTSNVDDLVATDTNRMTDVFVRDIQSGTTRLVSVNKDGTNSGISQSEHPVISSDGRFVAFFSYADDLVASHTAIHGDVFVRDLQSGTTTLVSVNKDGTDSGYGYSGYPAISADGRFVAFHSSASDLVTTDTNGKNDVFVIEVGL